MPEPPLFLQTFNLSTDKVFGKYKLTNIDINEEQKVRYNEYAYPMTLTLEWTNKTKPSKDDVDTMIKSLIKYVAGVRIAQIPTSGRYYKCVFIHPITNNPRDQVTLKQINGNTEVSLVLEGYAKRIGKDEAATVRETKKW